jgi:hypothetical protein
MSSKPIQPSLKRAARPTKIKSPNENPFWVINGDSSPLGGRTQEGMHYAWGMEWKCTVGDNLSRMAARARAACGKGRSWPEVFAMAAHANSQVQIIAERLSAKYVSELSEPGMTPAKLIQLHGPADLLAYGTRWNTIDTFAESEPDRQEDSPTEHQGAEVLAAFSLLMIDHAASELADSYPIAASEFLAIAGIALSSASMDQAQRNALLERFKISDSAKIGARSKWADRDEHMSFALKLAPSIASTSRAEVARQLADAIFKKFTKQWSDETVDGWLKDANWKPSPNTSVNDTESDPGSMPA